MNFKRKKKWKQFYILSNEDKDKDKKKEKPDMVSFFSLVSEIFNKQHMYSNLFNIININFLHNSV